MPALLVVLAAVCFGTTGTALALAPEGVSPLAAGSVRIVVGGAVLAAVVLLRRPAGPRPAAPPVDGRGRRVPSIVLVAIGAAAIVSYQPAFFVGTSRIGVAVGTIVALGSAPVVTGAFQWVLTRRFPGTLWAAATLVAMVGVTLLSVGSSGAGPGLDVTGLAGSLVAGASYAVYALVAKELIDRGASPSWVMGMLFGSAAVASLPLALASDPTWLASPGGAFLALWLGVVTTALAYLLFGQGLQSVSAASASTLTLAEPVTAALLGLVLLGERLQPTAVAGVVVVALAIVLLVTPWSRLRSGRGERRRA